MTLSILTFALLAAALLGCGSGDSTRDVTPAEMKARPNTGYDGPAGGK